MGDAVVLLENDFFFIPEKTTGHQIKGVQALHTL